MQTADKRKGKFQATISSHNDGYQSGAAAGGDAPVEGGLVADELGYIFNVSETYAFIESAIGAVFMPGSAYVMKYGTCV